MSTGIFQASLKRHGGIKVSLAKINKRFLTVSERHEQNQIQQSSDL